MSKRRNIFSNIIVAASVAVTMTAFPSCDAIFDDLEPCPEGLRLRFVYDYHMELGPNGETDNLFPSQVDCLTLFIYDTNGNYLTSVTETSSVLGDENWRMTIPLPPGDYRLEAWGGINCDKASFEFETNPIGLAMDKVQVNLKPSMMTSPKGKYLHPLFYGPRTPMTLTVPEDSEDYTDYTVHMMRDTNDIRVILQNLDGTPADGDDFIFSITDDNTELAYNNDVIPGHEYTYSPWTWGQSPVGLTPEGSEILAAYAEISTGRLITRNNTKLLIKRRSDDFTIVDLPLTNILLQLKSERFNWMRNQEFLDRKNEWSIYFILQGGQWLGTTLQIDDWVVRINDIVGE